MQYSEMKVGQLVRVTATCGGLFSSEFEGKSGRILSFTTEHVTLRFNNGEEDYGRPDNVTLVDDVVLNATSVKDAIANVEKALAILKALVG